MATKSETKSKIPLKVAKKELSTERARMRFGNCNFLKPAGDKENKNRTNTLKNSVNSKKTTTNQKETAKEQLDEEKKDCKPKKTTVRFDIETISQDLVNRLIGDNFKDNNENRTNVIPKNRKAETSSKLTNVPKKNTSPSALVKPKNCMPHSGLILKPTVKRSAVAAKTFNIKSHPPKLRRSISEYDFKLDRLKAETIRSQQKDKNINGKDKIAVDENCAKTTKSETISKSKKIDNKHPRGPPVQPKNPIVTGRMSKHFPVDRNSSKPVPSKPKPLRRSNTMHAFDSVPILKKGKVVQTNKSPAPKTVPEIANLEKGRTVTPENSNFEMPLSENLRAQFTPKKEIPHGGLVMNRNSARISKTKINAFGFVQ